MTEPDEAFLNDADLERSALRQGDIISDIHIVGALNLNSIMVTMSSADPGKAAAWTVPTPPVIANAMILSHDCEIDPENTTKVTSVILAPLRDISTATNPNRIDEVIASNVIDEGTDATYLKYFYVPPHSRLAFPRGAIVDFSKCFSVRKNCYDLLLSHKVAQLTRSFADSMALKLALYFSRQNEAA